MRFVGASGVSALVANGNVNRTIAFSTFSTQNNAIAGDNSNLGIEITTIGTPASGNSDITINVFYQIADILP
jgi:hypothetical protein